MNGAWDRVSFICKRKSMLKRQLSRELGFSSDVSASVRFNLQVKICRSCHQCLQVKNLVECLVLRLGLGVK